MPRDWWNPKEVQGMAADRRAVQFKITGGKPVRKKKQRRKNRQAKPSAAKQAAVPATQWDGKKDFFKSLQWRQLRYLALRNSGGCNCCGATAKDGVLLHVDHIKPISKFPDLRLSLDNVQVLCEDCNVGKGSWDETDWR